MVKSTKPPRRPGVRKIVVKGQKYLWRVSEGAPEDWVFHSASESEDPENPGVSKIVLMVASPNGRFRVYFYLGQPAAKRYLSVFGPDFKGLPDAGRCCIRVLCPEWQISPAVTPSVVCRLIEWCMFSEKEIVRVDEYGAPE